MKTINFQRLEIFLDIQKTQCQVMDFRKPFANTIYSSGYGIEAHALALKIYNSQGATEYSDEECNLIMIYAKKFGAPALIDCLSDILNT